MYKIYQVEYGDTLDIIAMKAGTTIDDIKVINGFNNDSDLVVGSLIIVPNSRNNLFDTYIVMQGDTVYSIAKNFNIDPQTLLLLNGLNKDDYIFPNQEITIPKPNMTLYITKQGDTIDFITNNLGIDANTLNSENNTIYVLEDQLIMHKKESNR